MKKVSSKLAVVEDNTGIVTEGQTGDNVLGAAAVNDNADHVEVLKSDIAETQAAVADLKEQIQALPAPSPFKQVVMVWFSFSRGGASGNDRCVLTDLPDIRMLAQVEAYEAAIKAQGQYERVFITNWRRLEG